MDLIAQKYFFLFQPSFYICTFNPRLDIYVSAAIQAGHGWESGMSRLLARMLAHYGPASILLDLGCNIGSHSLYVAALNHHVWAVDALTMNQVKVGGYCQAYFCKQGVTLPYAVNETI